MIEKKVKGRLCPWLNVELKSKMNEHDRQPRKDRSEDSQRCKILRNQCNSLLRKAKSKYHKNLLDENSLSPKFWNVIKNIFFPTKVKGTTPKTNNKDLIANKFSGWFSTIITSLERKVMLLKNFVWGDATNKKDKRTDKIFTFQYVSVMVFVKNQLKGLKRSKATGLNNLPPALLKDSADIIAKPFCHVINPSLQTVTYQLLGSKHMSCQFTNPDQQTLLKTSDRPISILPTKVDSVQLFLKFSTLPWK